MKQKHALAIEDITGLGKCSLTVALPILSVAGLTCSVLPTAVLSTHPSGFTGYTYRDLTVDILPMAEHWKTEGLSFDAVYSGFLGSCEQLESVQRIFQLFGQKETICLVDPVMGDNGKLYQMYTEDMVEGMRGLCRSATILTPNLTEAAFLTGIPYQAECYSEEYIQSLVKGLAALGAPQIVLTGISFDETRIGAACYRASEQSLQYVWATKVPEYFHGTGDTFSAALLDGLLNGQNLETAAQTAAYFTSRCIQRTAEAQVPEREGLCFEKELLWLGSRLQNLNNDTDNYTK